MFDTLDEGGTGRLTQQDLRVGLEKAHLLVALDESARLEKVHSHSNATSLPVLTCSHNISTAHAINGDAAVCCGGCVDFLQHQSNAQHSRSHTTTSDDSRHFRTSAHWSGSVNAIERAIPAQFHALREGIHIDDDCALCNSLLCVLRVLPTLLILAMSVMLQPPHYDHRLHSCPQRGVR